MFLNINILAINDSALINNLVSRKCVAIYGTGNQRTPVDVKNSCLKTLLFAIV